MAEVHARKTPIAPRAALALLDDVDFLIATRGKKVIEIDLRQGRPPAGELELLLIGPSGNLRAPTLRVGRTLLVGFDEAVYRRVLEVP